MGIKSRWCNLCYFSRPVLTHPCPITHRDPTAASIGTNILGMIPGAVTSPDETNRSIL
ncbi:unnamed protein product [Tenebrio molitor]|nr:unnamed protein product [Tenebrio molitor]